MIEANSHLEETKLSPEEVVMYDVLEKEVMPILCGDIETKLEKLNCELALTIEHIPGSPLSVQVHYKSGTDFKAQQLKNRSPKPPRFHGAKWTKPHLKKLHKLCDERVKLESIAKQLQRGDKAVLGKLQQIAQDEMWAYQYLVDSYLPVKYFKNN